jgi:predicted dithiol-disulfide oxidoreductase (DUF899 family)
MRRAARHEESSNPINWGYRIMYRPGQVNHCPGCGQAGWHVGRVTAQCAFCGTALALVQGGGRAPAEEFALSA